MSDGNSLNFNHFRAIISIFSSRCVFRVGGSAAGAAERDEAPDGRATECQRSAAATAADTRRTPVQQSDQTRRSHRRELPKLRPLRHSVRYPRRRRLRILLAIQRRSEEISITSHRTLDLCLHVNQRFTLVVFNPLKVKSKFVFERETRASSIKCANSKLNKKFR